MRKMHWKRRDVTKISATNFEYGLNEKHALESETCYRSEGVLQGGYSSILKNTKHALEEGCGREDVRPFLNKS